MRILPWIAVLVAIAVVDARPSKKNEQNVEPVDESDRTLIRVARADLDEDEEEPKVTSHKNRHKKRSEEDVVSRKKRATEEDEFFQALLSRKEDSRKEKKRSYEEGAEDKAYIKRDDWKGDSKISDADRQELENLFSEITSPEEEKEKVDETRSLKPGMDGKVQNFIEWLMSQPPEKFTKSLSHILDTEASLTKTFYDENAPASSQDADGSSNSTNSTQGSNCKNKCYTFKFGDTKCEIECSPPVIEKPTDSPFAANMQQTPYMPYPVQSQMPCTAPNCPGAGVQGYPQASYPAPPQYGAQMPAMTPQWPVQNGCTGASCDTGKRKSDQGKDSDKEESKDDKDDSTADTQGVAAQVPVASQGPDNTMQVGPIQVMADPSASFSPMVPVAPVAPVMPAPVSPVAPVPVPVPQAPAQPYMNGYPQQGDETQKLQPMPKDCEDYSSPECQVFLDWPTDEHNEVKASLRFRQNWDDDYNDKESRRFKVLKAEIEKGIANAYFNNPNFESVEVNSLSKEDMKVSANFVMRFKQAEFGVLRYLSRAISSNYLQSMPVYRNTLLRDGLKHHHRSIVAKQEELDKVPSKIQDPEPEIEEPLTTASRAYQGCFRDRKPIRDLPTPFSKYDMTPEWCVGRCKLGGYKFAGLQYAYLCFCGNSFGKYGRAQNDQCDSHCFGDSNRFCGSFWHNSVYSVDGKAYNPMKEQHANINGEYEGDEDEDEKDDKDEHESEDIDSSSDDSSASGSGEESDDPTPAAQVANKLMKAAASALQAAKKLLPHGDKSKRSNDEELEKSKADAIAALGAAQNLMKSRSQVVRRESERKKREAELQHGKDLLVAYLSDVGGYDRQYRDVEDEDENGSKDKDTKFEYRRMVIDESGDGEFVERKIDQKKIERARLRRNIASQNTESFNGPMKMASRAVEENTDITKRSLIPVVPGIPAPVFVEAEHKPSDDDDSADEATESGNGDEPEDSGDSFEDDDDDAESGESEHSEDDVSSNDSSEADDGLESGESGNAEESGEEADEQDDEQDDEEYGFSRETRSVGKSDAMLTRTRRDVEEEEEKHEKTRKTRKRDVSLSDDKVSTIEELAKEGIQDLVPIVVGIFKQERRMRAVDDFIAQLKQSILKSVSVSQEQEQVLMDRTTNIIKTAALAKLNELSTSIRADMQEYKSNHPAVTQQAKEALDAILDLPVFQDAVDNLKNRIKKRAVDLEEEYKKVKEGSETLPPILKEHFKRNAPEDKKKNSLSRRHRDVKH